MGIFKNQKRKPINDKESNSLSKPFAKGSEQNPHDVVDTKKEALTLFASWRHHKLESKEVEKQLAEITRNIIQAQTEHLKHELLLGLDQTKKERYAIYLDEIDKINAKIVAQSAAAAASLMEGAHKVVIKSYEDADKFKHDFEELYKNNIITKEQFDEEAIRILENQQGLKTYVDNMITSIIDQTEESFSSTIKLFKEKKITSF